MIAVMQRVLVVFSEALPLVIGESQQILSISSISCFRV
jgi:hypothetical protein